MPDTFLDSVESRLMEVGGLSGAHNFEKARRFLQQGTVAGAGRALTNAKALNPYAILLEAGIQLGKGVYLTTKEGARDGHAEAGKELTKKPLLYQIGKTFLDPADSFSKYGAYKEELDKKAFEKYLEEEYPWAGEWTKKQNAEIAARRAKESGTAAR
jgi:hypothetical protein